MKEKPDDKIYKLRCEMCTGIAADINKALAERRMNKADLARIMGTSRSNITQIIKGNRNFTIDTMCEIAESLEMVACVTFKKKRKGRPKKVLPE